MPAGTFILAYQDFADFSSKAFENATGNSFPASISASSFGAEGSRQDQPGIWPDGDNRWVILQDQDFNPETVALHAMKSSDFSATWTEADAAHSPGSTTWEATFWQAFFLATAFDPVGRKLYAVYIFTAPGAHSSLSQFHFAICPFGIATETWGSPIVSTLALGSPSGTVTGPDNRASAGAGPSVSYLPHDNSVIVTFYESIAIGSFTNYRAQYVKFDCGSLTWGSWVRIGQADNTTAQDWVPLSAGPDSAGNVHFALFHNFYPTSGAQAEILHQVLHTDNSLSSLDTAATIAQFNANVPSGTGQPSNQTYAGRAILWQSPSGQEIVFGWMNDPPLSGSPSNLSSIMIARGLAGDAPTWTVETPILGLNTDSGGLNAPSSPVLAQVGSLLYLFYTYDDGSTFFFRYVTNAGAGLGWSAPTTIGSFSDANGAWRDPIFNWTYFTAYGFAAVAPVAGPVSLFGIGGQTSAAPEFPASIGM